MIFEKKYTPRWIVFSIDVLICLASIVIAFFLRFNFEIPQGGKHSLIGIIVPFVLTVRITSFIFARTYTGIVRYSGFYDTRRIFLTLVAGTILMMICNIISYEYITYTYIVPISILIIDLMGTVLLMIALRIIVKFLFIEYNKSTMPAKSVIVYGSGLPAIMAKQTIEQDINLKYKVVAFVDDLEKPMKKKIEGVDIHQEQKLTKLFVNEKVDFLILAKPEECLTKKKKIIELCLSKDIKVLSVPTIEKWEEGNFNAKQIERVKIEDLLERPPIDLDEKNIKADLSGKVVLVTGAAGSIGSEIVRQLFKFKPKNIILLDQAETPMYEIEIQLKEELNVFNFEIVIGDMVHRSRIEKIFKAYSPDVVFHAAAYKHVPMMENNPAEAINTNVKGTKIIADLSDKYGVKKFVMVSTDKAVNPTNIMGASKRLAEMYIQSLNENSKTNFITTRFGNVLGSNGSVIPRFRKQIEEGGPVTVTHPQITRFFMTIPEACQLVLEAGSMGKGGEIFIFDMGESVKIVDLAKKMIKLYGLKLGKDIQINFTGLRPGEKLYEELLATKENTIPTHNDQIMIAKVSPLEYEYIDKEISELIETIKSQHNMAIVEKMKKIIPEFISQNSIYEKLDNMHL